MTSRPTIRVLFVLLAIVGASFSVAACGRNELDSPTVTTDKQTGIVAGYGEQTFAERYRLSIRLPMPEAEFLALLQKLGLSYSICGERGSETGLPPLRQQTTIDLSKAQRCYQVYGDIDSNKHVGKIYRAFVGKDHQIIYIENAFSYTGP